MATTVFFTGWYGYNYVKNPAEINYGPVEKICFVVDVGLISKVQKKVI